ncbi:hypothetical protein ABT267_38860, partial [Nonomuraea sp. NPDC001023]
AVFTVIADLGTGGKTGQALRAATADGEFLVVMLTAAGMIAGLLITLTLPRLRRDVTGAERPEPSRAATG